MGLHQETAVSVCAVRQVTLPAGSWHAGDENGKAIEVLVRDTGDGVKLPKTTVTADQHRATTAEKLAAEQPFVERVTFDSGSVETYSYRFRRFDAIEKTVYTYLCIVTDSEENADPPFKWVPWGRWEDYLTHPYESQLYDIKQTMKIGMSQYDTPFKTQDHTTQDDTGSRGAERRKIKRRATADTIRNEHRPLDEFEESENNDE